jgi:hypothetical protein
MPGEAGLLMCTFPRDDWNFQKASGTNAQPDFAGYFNECMNGFEYQVASHMLWEGMTLEGMAVIRAVHDRYAASRRNPWNEVEWGDHYARSMASYGVFLSACGFSYHGPKGQIGFAPRITAADFRAAFTAAEGWGTYAQKVTGESLRATVTVKWGKLFLSELNFQDVFQSARVLVTVDGRTLEASLTRSEGQYKVTLKKPVHVFRNQILKVEIFAA